MFIIGMHYVHVWYKAHGCKWVGPLAFPPFSDPFSRGSSATPHHTAAKAPSASEHTPALKEAVVKCIEQVLHPLYKQGEFSKCVGASVNCIVHTISNNVVH